MDMNTNNIYQSVLILKVSECFLFSEESMGADMGQWYLKKSVKFLSITSTCLCRLLNKLQYNEQTEIKQLCK